MSRKAAEAPPFPPVDLAVRVGARGIDRARYVEVGRMSRAAILGALPDDWTFAGKRVLDFGCGAGRTLRHFLDEAQVGDFYGCDIDEPSIAWLEDNLSPPLNVFVNSEKPPLELEAASLDVIWAISVFTHISDQWSAWLVELHRLLRDDGLLVATILGPDRKRPVDITVSELERIDASEWREIEALKHNIRQLHHESQTVIGVEPSITGGPA